jgi:flagellar biosynthesis/type III secretory pathway chaperone
MWRNKLVVDDLAGLTKARSMLILLLATSKQTQVALEAVANVLDTELTTDLGDMINRSESELEEVNAKIAALSGK